MTSLAAATVLPPVSLLFLTGVGLAYARKRVWALPLAWTSLVLLAIFCLPATALLLARPFEAVFPPLEWSELRPRIEGSYMALVLGGGKEPGAAEYPGAERLSASSLQRARYGARVARGLGVPIAVAGGKPEGGRYSEADLMRAFIVEELKQEVALVEDRSTNTRENAVFAAEQLKAAGVTGVVLVTDVTHMPRASAAFRATGLRVIPAPLRFRAGVPLQADHFVPSSHALEESHRLLREALRLAWYSAFQR